jgi:hypothetical protein
MKIKAPFTVETHRKPLFIGKGGSYRPKTYFFYLYALCGRLVQTCKHEVEE